MTSRSMFSRLEMEFLHTVRVGRVATVDLSSGYPHVVPICFVFDGTSFHTTLSEGSKRVRNIKSGSKVSLLFDKYEEQDGEWVALQGLLIRCRVHVLRYAEDTDSFMEGWRLLIRKYPQYKKWANEDLTPRDPKRRLIMRMEPIQKTSWGFAS